MQVELPTYWNAGCLFSGCLLPFVTHAPRLVLYPKSVLQVGWALAAHAFRVRRQPETRGQRVPTLRNDDGCRLGYRPVGTRVVCFQAAFCRLLPTPRLVLYPKSVLQVGWALAAHAFHARRQPETAWATSAHPTERALRASVPNVCRLCNTGSLKPFSRRFLRFPPLHRLPQSSAPAGGAPRLRW